MYAIRIVNDHLYLGFSIVLYTYIHAPFVHNMCIDMDSLAENHRHHHSSFV